MGLRPVVRLRGRVEKPTIVEGIVPAEGRPAAGPEPRIHSAGSLQQDYGGVHKHPPIARLSGILGPAGDAEWVALPL